MRVDRVPSVPVVVAITALSLTVTSRFACAGVRPARAAREPFVLRFTLPHEARVRLGIYDASGSRVCMLASGALPAGEHALAWDLRDQSGRPVHTGLYFARLEAEGHALANKLVTVR